MLIRIKPAPILASRRFALSSGSALCGRRPSRWR
jgi:hypothetical protein